MRSIIYTILLGFIFILATNEAKAQDPHFSQFYITPLTLNPALTGLKNGPLRAAVNYRQQWGSIGTPFRTMSLSVDYNVLQGSIGDDLMGVGLVVFNDMAGEGNLRRTNIDFTTGYSKNIIDDGIYLSVGFQAGLSQHSIDPTRLSFENQFDGQSLNEAIASGEEFARTSIWNYDLGAGLAWTYSVDKYTNYYVGGSIRHLNRQQIGFLEDSEDRRDMKYSLYGGIEFRVNGYISVLPRGVLLLQGEFKEINLGSYVKINATKTRNSTPTYFQIGAMYRYKDAIIPMFRFDWGPMAIGMSYDINISALTRASNTRGGLELAIIYKGANDGFDRGAIHCPDF